MNQEGVEFFRNELVPALLSGAYTQTHQVLHDDNGFCCLGVACDLENPAVWYKPSYSNKYYWPEYGTTVSTTLTYGQAQKYGIEQNGGDAAIQQATVELFPHMTTIADSANPIALAYLNDGYFTGNDGEEHDFEPFDFQQIAAVLSRACDIAEAELRRTGEWRA